MHGEYRDSTLADHFLRVGAHDGVAKAAAPMRSHDDQVAATRHGILEDGARRAAARELADLALYGHAGVAGEQCSRP